MTFPRSLARVPLLAAALALAACSDSANPVQPDFRQPDADLTVALTCTVSTRGGEVRCTDGVAMGGGARGIILGGQNTYIRLASSNIQVTPGSLSFDVTVENMIAQPLGVAADGEVDSAGVRVFFVAGPSSTSGGSVTVANPDGMDSFTGPDQPYFQYEGGLFASSVTDEVSEPKTWTFGFTPEVENITFKVLVAAQLQWPDGFILNNPWVVTLDPQEAVEFTASVYNALGMPLPDEPVTWSSDAPAIASVNGPFITAGTSNGFAQLTAMSGTRPGLYPTWVSVCQSAVVGNGTSLPASLTDSDCFSSYGSETGTPTTDFYADLYRVTLEEGQTVTVTLDSGDQLDTFLLVTVPGLGVVTAFNDDDDQETLGVGSRVVFTAPISGVYVIEASTYNELDTGDYTLGVTIS
ncbi:PPC domain-containing protein [Longimicrobium terrae]|uniref:Peptidase C-terminal archaeal/bacterial domain-containing protein n=1 Tax=Longimicrobium terrae TaxID=1639882 RepID=A0A841H511_9BACT|nr:PPC domain-containing protein [Longimicrobium terrae]MBB4638825.1 hypothetical protein [Longimicrobium terrae]MBB6073064.1 hypothetical protein [Longimicrobium terrae]NNC33187.1 hypothetical protein [Longimicrobium terrae]